MRIISMLLCNMQIWLGESGEKWSFGASTLQRSFRATGIMNELTDAQREALKTLPASFLVKLRAAVAQKRELDEAMAVEEDRVNRLRDMVQEWKSQHEQAFEAGMSELQRRLESSEEGASQAMAHSDKTKQAQIAALDEQLLRRGDELERIDKQINERQTKIDETKAQLADLQLSMENKRLLIEALSGGGNFLGRTAGQSVTRRAAMTLVRADGKPRAGTIRGPLAPMTPRASLLQSNSMVAGGTPRSPRPGSNHSTPRTIAEVLEEKEAEPVNSPEMAESVSKVDMETVPARVALESLLELLLDPSALLVTTMSTLFRGNDMDRLAKAMVEIFATNGEFMPLLKAALEREVQGTHDIGTLFRSNSVASRLMSSFSRSVGIDYLKSLLKPKIDAIIAAKEDLEVDAMKIAEDQVAAQRQTVEVNPQVITAHVARICELATDILTAVLNAKSRAPLEYYQIANLLKEVVCKKFPDQVRIAIGGYLFLRLMCPVIFLPPEEFGYHFDTVASEAKRTLVLVSKVLQNLANFQPKFVEELMMPFSPFVVTNMPIVEEYFNFMATVPESALPSILPEYPIRQRLREILTIMSQHQTKLVQALASNTEEAATEQCVQLWSFNKAPKLISLYNRLSTLAASLPYPDDSPDVRAFYDFLVPPTRASTPAKRPGWARVSVSSAVAPQLSLPLADLTTQAVVPHALLAILETSTRLDFTSAENAELAGALLPLFEYRDQSLLLVRSAADVFLSSPTKSNRPLSDSIAAKAFTLWAEYILPSVSKATLGSTVFSMVAKKEILPRREVIMEITTSFLECMIAALNDLPDPVYQFCHHLFNTPRFGAATVVQFIFMSFWVKALEDPDTFQLPTGGGDRLVKKGLLMVADHIVLIATGSRDRQNATVDTFLTTMNTKITDAVTAWMQKPKAPASAASPSQSSPSGDTNTPPSPSSQKIRRPVQWVTVSESLDSLRVFLGRNMSSLTAILERSTSEQRYVKFTVSEVVSMLVKHVVAKPAGTGGAAANASSADLN